MIPAVADPHPNRESTALKLADQGGFWVGVQRKKMPYGEIAQGQMYVQYMIPAERAASLPGCDASWRRRPGHAHDGHRRTPRLGALLRAEPVTAVYWVDRPSYGRSPYHPDALGPSHLPNVPPFEGLLKAPPYSTPRSGPDPAA